MDLVTIILGGILILLLGFYWHLTKNRGYLESIGIPLIKPFLCFGSPPYFISDILYHEVYQENFNKYGKTWCKYEGVQPLIVTADLDIVKEIAIKQFDSFTDTFPNDFSDDQQTLDIAKGETWKILRKLLSPTFTTGKLKSMIDPIDLLADNSIAHIKEMSQKSSSGFNIKPFLQGFSLDAINKVAFGIDTKCYKGENEDMILWTQKLMEGFAPTSKVEDFFFQVFFHLPELTPGGFWNEYALKFAKLTKDVCDERDAKNIHIGDFCDTLRKLKLEAKPPITDTMINSQGMIFITAGFETTSNTMGACLYFLAKNPDVQEKLYEEILDVVGDDHITYDTIRDLAYLEASIDETLRMHPPVICHFRSCVKDCVIKGVPFKKGTNVQLAIQACHMDPELFPEPEKFKPERFLKENADQIVPYSFRPFGAGPRVCIGQRFALTEVKLFMAKMLKEFRVVNTPQTKMDYNLGQFFLLAYPEMFVKLEPRN